MKAKVGDKVVITFPRGTGLRAKDEGKIAEVIEVNDGRIYFDARKTFKRYKYEEEPIKFYLLDGCYELEHVYNSPLYKALK